MGDVANPNRGRPRGGRPPAWLLAAAACALAAAAWGGSGIGLNVLHGFAEPWAGPDACADGPCTVRFMAYNIQWGLGADGVHDLDRIAAVLRRADADVVALDGSGRELAPQRQRAPARVLGGSRGLSALVFRRIPHNVGFGQRRGSPIMGTCC